MVTVALVGLVALRVQVALLLVSGAVAPLTTTVWPTSASAVVDCAVVSSETRLLNVSFGLHLLLDAGELHELLGELIGVERIERVLVFQLRGQQLQEGR